MNIGPRLKQTRLEKGLSQAKLAQLSGVSQGLIAQIEAGTNQGSKHVTKIAKALDVDADWLAGGSGTAGRSTAADKDSKKDAAPKKWPFKTINEDDLRALSGRDAALLEGAIALAIAQLKIGVRVDPESAAAAPPSRVGVVDLSTVEDPFPPGPRQPMPWEVPPVDSVRPYREDLRISTAANVGHVAHAGYSANDQEYVPVPELSVRLAAGKLGIENYSETEIGEIMLRRSFLESFGLPVERMKIVYADGDSMEPVIRHQGPMLFYEDLVSDQSQIDTRTVYAINYGGKMVVKCLVRDRFNKWMARSLNPSHKDFPLAEDDGREVRIVGRILWSPYDLRNGVDERLVRR